jgi:actin-related protein 6
MLPHFLFSFCYISFHFRLVPNCVVKAKTVRNRVFIGDQIDDCKDLSGLFYLLPFQKVRATYVILFVPLYMYLIGIFSQLGCGTPGMGPHVWQGWSAGQFDKINWNDK